MRYTYKNIPFEVHATNNTNGYWGEITGSCGQYQVISVLGLSKEAVICDLQIAIDWLLAELQFA